MMDGMTVTALHPDATSELQDHFDRLRDASRSMPPASLATRLDRLARIMALTNAHAAGFAAAISDDFGHRPRQVTEIADLMVVRGAVAHARRRLRRWMKPRRVATPLSLQPGRSHVQAQPLGVVGIVAPWNYPYQLAMSPAVSALAAGNRVMIKPSELTPRFAALLQEAVAAYFAEDEMVVVTGDAAVARRFVALPFDHLLFTGSTAVGREVALAAAANLTPVTLELGGKSPAILNADCDLALAARRLMAAKLFNTGQTCVAPDYLLVHESLLGALPAALREATMALYPTIAGNADYASIVDDRHLARLQALVDDAVACGGGVVPLHSETVVHARRQPPVAIVGVVDRMKVMRDEIFGPLLPIVGYRDVDEAIAWVNARRATARAVLVRPQRPRPRGRADAHRQRRRHRRRLPLPRRAGRAAVRGRRRQRTRALPRRPWLSARSATTSRCSASRAGRARGCWRRLTDDCSSGCRNGCDRAAATGGDAEARRPSSERHAPVYDETFAAARILVRLADCSQTPGARRHPTSPT